MTANILLQCICATEQSTADNTPSAVSVPVTRSSLLNGSSDDLWTDTDDESFIRATQCVLDAAPDGFTSPMAVSRSTAVTSTPNVKSSRCRRTFCLEPAPPVLRHVNIRPRHAAPAVGTCSSVPAVKDASFSDELLATLAEPDEVLDSQIKVTDTAVTVDGHNTVSNIGPTERRDICAGNTMMGMYYFTENFA